MSSLARTISAIDALLVHIPGDEEMTLNQVEMECARCNEKVVKWRNATFAPRRRVVKKDNGDVGEDDLLSVITLKKSYSRACDRCDSNTAHGQWRLKTTEGTAKAVLAVVKATAKKKAPEAAADEEVRGAPPPVFFYILCFSQY